MVKKMFYLAVVIILALTFNDTLFAQEEEVVTEFVYTGLAGVFHYFHPGEIRENAGKRLETR